MVQSVRLRLKTMVASGSSDKEAISKLSGTVLGYNWDPEKDLLGVSFKYNTSRKNKGRRISPNLGLKDPQEFRLAYHNRRTLLSMCNGIYDLLGLCSLYTIKFKILMKETLNIEIPGDSDGAIKFCSHRRMV